MTPVSTTVPTNPKIAPPAQSTADIVSMKGRREAPRERVSSEIGHESASNPPGGILDIRGEPLFQPVLLETRLQAEEGCEYTGGNERPGAREERPRQGHQQQPPVDRVAHPCVGAGHLELGPLAGSRHGRDPAQRTDG